MSVAQPPERISPRTAERRSPRALSADPPVTRRDWVVDADLSGDEFLAAARRRADFTDAEWERILRHGGLHLDRRRWLCESPPERVSAGTAVVAYSFEREPAPLAPLDVPGDAVLLDEEGLVAVNKPPWWASQGTRASRVVSLEQELRRRLDCPTLTPVHRLDRETSGVMLFARDGRAAGELGRQFARRQIRKEYLALVSPPASRPEWTVDGFMVRIEHPSHSLFTLLEPSADSDTAEASGQPSRTRFERLATRGERSLVRAHPLTGRTHQLRVHLLASGIPIAGDSLYGGGWAPGQPWSAERLQLHACAIELTLKGRALRIEAPLPADFEWAEGVGGDER